MAITDDRSEGVGPAEAETLANEAQRAASDPARQRANDPYAALRFRDFRYLIASSSLATLGEQMLTVAIGWDIYSRTHSALMLGFVGLAQFAPVLALSLVAGHAADRFDRRVTVMLSQGLMGLPLTAEHFSGRANGDFSETFFAKVPA